MNTKICIRCREEKPLDFFYLQGGKWKGRGWTYSSCKQCHNQALLDRRKQNPHAAEIQLEARRNFRRRHPDEEKRWVSEANERLTPGVVSNRMGLRKHEAPPQLIECKRALIKLNRLIQQHENKQH
jgi:hypothetical protein